MGVKNKIYLASIVVSFISVFVSYLFIEQLLLEAEKLAKQLKLDPISEPLRLALQKDQNCQSK